MLRRITVAALLLVLGTATTLSADEPRQSYSAWSFSKEKGYYFAKFTYKPSAGPCEPKTHYCILKPDEPHRVYYFNPYEKKFWARFDAKAEEGKQFSVLKPEARKETLAEIAEREFPEPAAAPELPEATDGETVEPPSDLPEPG